MNRFDVPVARLGTSSIKWDRCKGKFETDKDLIPLWIADTDFRAPEEVISAIHARADHGVFGYTFAMPDYLAVVADWFRRRHGLSADPEWIVPTYGVVTALHFTIEALTEPGDRVLILTPSYDPFFAIVQNTGRTLAECRLRCDHADWTIDFDRLEEEFRRGVKLMILCNPHNPVARVWTKTELKKVADLCVRYGVYLASDEIHADVELFGNRYTSMAAFDEVRERVLCYTSAGKSFSLTGLCASNLIIPDAGLRSRVADKIRGAWIMSPNIFGLTATEAAYRQGEPWLDEELAYLEGNARFVQDFLASRLPEVFAAKQQGTFLMWLDFSALHLEDGELARRMVDSCGLGLGVGSHYGKDCGQYMRLNIGCARDLLARAMDAMTRIREN